MHYFTVFAIVFTAHAGSAPNEQVASTLENLVKSLEDEAQQAEATYNGRQQWCNAQQSSSKNRQAEEDDQVSQIESEVAEVDAAAQEIASGVAKLKVEAEAEKAEAASEKEKSSLQEAKGLSLSSFQHELSAELPLLSAKRTQASELHTKLRDVRNEHTSSNAVAAFVSEGCDKSLERMRDDAAVRVEVVKSLKEAKHLLTAQGPPSFVQMASLEKMVAQKKADLKEAQRKKRAAADPTGRVAHDIEGMISQLQHSGKDAASDACAHEKYVNGVAKQWREEEVQRLATEMGQHKTSVEAVKADVDAKQQDRQSLVELTSAVEEQSQKDTQELQKLVHDRKLALSIVTQAANVVQNSSPEARKVLLGVAKLIKKEAGALSAAEEDSKMRAEVISKKVKHASASIDADLGDLEIALSFHTRQQTEAAMAKDKAEAELKKVTEFLQTLDADCDTTHESQRRNKEVHALKDVVQVLGGRYMPPRVASQGQSGDLAPLEKAALEMGVAMQQ